MSKQVLDATKEKEGIKLLPCGVRVKYSQISLSIFDEINKLYPDPDPPMVEIEEKSEPGKPYMESNPNDPDYRKKLKDLTQVRGNAIIDAVIILGAELLDPIPDDKWLKLLEYTAKITGVPDLSDFDLADDMDKEFVYKKFYAIGRDGLDDLLKSTGVTEEGIEDANASFPGDEKRCPDTEFTP